MNLILLPSENTTTATKYIEHIGVEILVVVTICFVYTIYCDACQRPSFTISILEAMFLIKMAFHRNRYNRLAFPRNHYNGLVCILYSSVR